MLFFVSCIFDVFRDASDISTHEPSLFVLCSVMVARQADRQTVLFSATMPGDVQAIASVAMRPSYEVVDCVGEEENTHEHVTQK